MSNPSKPFRLNVGFIVHEEVGFTRQFIFKEEIVQIDELSLFNLTGRAAISRTPQGLFLQAEFRGEISLECARCLKMFDHSLLWSLSELYAFDKRSVTDSGLLLPETAQIDLAPLIREYALLEIPINPICKPDCKGLCPVCGENRNDKDCGHRAERNDSPFAALKDLF